MKQISLKSMISLHRECSKAEWKLKQKGQVQDKIKELAIQL